MVYHSTLHSSIPIALGTLSYDQAVLLPFFVWEAPADFCAPPKKKKKEKEHLIAGYRDTNVSCQVKPSSNALPFTIMTNSVGKYEASLKSLHLHCMNYEF